MSVYDDARALKYNNHLPYDTTPHDVYLDETIRLNNEFKTDLEIQHGFFNHPKADAIYALAWDYGHSSGYSEVAMYYEELSALLL